MIFIEYLGLMQALHALSLHLVLWWWWNKWKAQGLDGGWMAAVLALVDSSAAFLSMRGLPGCDRVGHLLVTGIGENNWISLIGLCITTVYQSS